MQYKKLYACIANWQKQLFDNNSYGYMLDVLTETKCVAALK